MGELNGFMRRIKKVDEFIELFFPVGHIIKTSNTVRFLDILCW